MSFATHGFPSSPGGTKTARFRSVEPPPHSLVQTVQSSHCDHLQSWSFVRTTQLAPFPAHFWACSRTPLQSKPGVVTDLVRVVVPSPHFWEQLPQALQSEYPQGSPHSCGLQPSISSVSPVGQFP